MNSQVWGIDMNDKFVEFIKWYKGKEKQRADEISRLFPLGDSERRVYTAIIELYLKDQSRARVTASQISSRTGYDDKRSIFNPLNFLQQSKYIVKTGRNSYVIDWEELENKIINKNMELEEQLKTTGYLARFLELISPEKNKEVKFIRYNGDEEFFEYIKYLLNSCLSNRNENRYIFIMTKEFSALDDFGEFKDYIHRTTEKGVKFKIILHIEEVHKPEVQNRINTLLKNKNIEIKLCSDRDFSAIGASRFLLVTSSDNLLDENLYFDGITVDSKVAYMAPRGGYFFTNYRRLILGAVFNLAWENGKKLVCV
jgi:hypothetical protein